MNDLNVIDRFTQTFVTFIDSGFGLLEPDVAFLTTVLVAIDITLAGLFWALAEDKSVIPSLIRKVLYVGAFALIINNFQTLSGVIFDSFAGLGLQATGTSMSAADLLRPGFVAGVGFEAAWPLLEVIGDLIGPVGFFTNFVEIAVLLLSWLIVLLAFSILAIQLFITILEFKLTTLAGFVLVPFALWNKTSFLAERVLGNVVAAGIKLMVLAVILGIGSTLFSAFASSFTSGNVTFEQAAATVLGALALFMLGIFGPGIAAGLVSGAPQLGAGAVAGSVAGLAIGGAAAGGLALGGARALGSGAIGATKAAASVAGGTGTAFGLAQATSGAIGTAGVAAGIAGVAKAGAGLVGQGMRTVSGRAASGIGEAVAGGGRGAFSATGGTLPATAQAASKAARSGGASGAPEWARKLRSHQRMREGATVTAHTLRDGDRPGHAEAPRLRDED